MLLSSFSYLLKIEFRNKQKCYLPALVSPYWEKLCPLSRVRLSACGLGPYSRQRAEFFPMRTSRPVNNIYSFHLFYDFADKCYKQRFHFGPMNSSDSTEAIPQARAMQIMKTGKLTNWMSLMHEPLLSTNIT